MRRCKVLLEPSHASKKYRFVLFKESGLDPRETFRLTGERIEADVLGF